MPSLENRRLESVLSEIGRLMVRRFASLRLVAWVMGAALVAIYAWIFLRLLPPESGLVGHDYSYFLPHLLNGYYWFLENGLFAVPWFTPARCGGLPLYPNPESFYYSLPQLLTLVMNPLVAVRGTFIIFAALGYAGMLRLLRGDFQVSHAAAILGATIFLFNGYFAHRIIIGHFGFHAFMLIPWIAHLQLRCMQRESSGCALRRAVDAILVGLCVAYMIQSGDHDLLSSLFSVLCIGLVYAFRGGAIAPFLVQGAAGYAIAGLLCSSKLTSVFSFMANFPRSEHLLRGSESFGELVEIVAKSLFFEPAYRQAHESMTNVAFFLGRHEFEYGVTLVPAVILTLAALWVAARLISRRRTLGAPSLRAALVAAALVTALLFPILANYYTPWWNDILKGIPLIKNQSHMVRWIAVYIPLLSLFSALSVQLTPRRWHLAIAAAGVAIVVISNITVDRSEYENRLERRPYAYNPRTVLHAYDQASKTRSAPKVTALRGVARGSRARTQLQRDDLIAHGFSQIQCYEAIFGYDLEWFPPNELIKGPALSRQGEFLNVLNPACFVFPEENQCRPGERFRIGQTEQADRFVGYRGFSFEKSRLQNVADIVNLLSLLLVAAYLIGYAVFARVTR